MTDHSGSQSGGGPEEYCDPGAGAGLRVDLLPRLRVQEGGGHPGATLIVPPALLLGRQRPRGFVDQSEVL